MSFSHCWLMNIEGFEETPLTAGFYDDRWYNQTSSSIFTKRTLLPRMTGDDLYKP